MGKTGRQRLNELEGEIMVYKPKKMETTLLPRNRKQAPHTNRALLYIRDIPMEPIEVFLSSTYRHGNPPAMAVLCLEGG
jgi:hypothetical protein